MASRRLAHGGVVLELLPLPSGSILASDAFMGFDRQPIANIVALTVRPQVPEVVRPEMVRRRPKPPPWAPT